MILSASWVFPVTSPYILDGAVLVNKDEIQDFGTTTELVARYPKDCIAVVSHGDVIKMIVAFYLGMELDLYQRIIISTASVSELRFFSGAVSVLRVNQTMSAPGGK